MFTFLLVTLLAQSPNTTIWLDSLGWGPISGIPIDADGNPFTEEWLVTRASDNARRVVTLHGSVCAGPWFFKDTTFRAWSLEPKDGKTKLVIQGRYDPPFVNFPLEVINLDMPSVCLP